MLRIIALAILAIAPVVVFPLAALAQGARGSEGVQNEATERKFQAFSLRRIGSAGCKITRKMANGCGLSGTEPEMDGQFACWDRGREKKHLQQRPGCAEENRARRRFPAGEQFELRLVRGIA